MNTGTTTRFGKTPNDEDVILVRIGGEAMTASIMSWGASLQDLRLGSIGHSLVLGSPQFEPYLTCMRYFGSIVGPVANRISGGRFDLDGKWFELDCNENGVTTLHGGHNGIGQRNWTLLDLAETRCEFGLRHPDGLCGFPGNIDISISYEINQSDTLVLTVRATTDRATHFNAAFHGLWNLDGTDDLASHGLLIPAEHYLPVDDLLIPLGPAAPVAGTKFDYRSQRTPDRDLDHNFCLKRTRGEIALICELSVPSLTMAVTSTEPGLQVYSGGTLNTGAWPGHNGRPYGQCAGIALEPQNWPNSPNEPTYPSTRLNQGETYFQQTTFEFSKTH